MTQNKGPDGAESGEFFPGGITQHPQFRTSNIFCEYLSQRELGWATKKVAPPRPGDVLCDTLPSIYPREWCH